MRRFAATSIGVWHGMASDAPAHAPLAPPSVCASPSRQQMDGVSLQRPFTASGARRTRLLAVQVHWGEHLDRLSTAKTDDTPDAVAPSTYVALRAGRHAIHTDSATQKANSHTSLSQQDEDTAEGECYELRSPPFATSRVAERSAHPKWNELLLVSLPIGWRQLADAGTWMLHVDIVGRDHSQQEDSLLATVELLLAPLATHHTPQHLRLTLQPLHDDDANLHLRGTTDHQPSIYVSLSETDNLQTPQEVAEITAHELVHAASLTPKPDALSNQILLLFVSASRAATPSNLHDIFLTPQAAERSQTTSFVWISPMARLKAVDGGDRRLQWQFPMILYRQQTASGSADTFGTVDFHLYAVGSSETPSFARVASATVDLLHVQLNGTPTAVQASFSTLSQTPQGDTQTDQPQLKLTVRRWNAVMWLRFQNTSVSRRVITTNRRHRKRAELLALEWTGALCRGLNRYPISSFCDEGGISSLLASYLAASNTATTDANGHPLGDGSHAMMEGGEADARLPLELLNQHIRLLQQEVVAKQEAIQKIQQELDARNSALQRCGAELVAARKEVRARDERVAQLQATIREREERDAGQTRELLAGTGGLTGLRLDSQGAQRMNVLVFQYKELEQRYQATVAKLTDAKRAIGVYEQLERKYADLEQAHIVQAALVQRLQKDKTQNAELQKTIRMQEKVIRKFEKAVQHQRQQSQSPQRPTAAANGPLSASPTGADAVPDSPLLAMRVQVLEQQLQVNAKSAANEIGRLKMRIMELETQLSHQEETIADDQDFPHQRRR